MSRLLDQIIRGNYRIENAFDARHQWSTEAFRKNIRYFSERAVAIDAQNVFEWCVDNPPHKDFLMSELYPLVPNRLPFDTMWLEGCLIECSATYDAQRHVHLGMLLFEAEPPYPQGLGRSIYMLHFLRIGTETPLLLGGCTIHGAPFGETPKGEMIGAVYPLQIAKPVGLDENLDSEMWDALSFTLHALIFFSCKNTSVRKSESRAKQSAKSIRKSGHPLPDFHVIDVHHFSERQRASETFLQPPHSHTEHSLAQAHIVRGHFKHYSVEAPLMGRHVGTFFWHAQVRGEKGRATRPSRYRIWGPDPEHRSSCKLGKHEEEEQKSA